MDHKRDFDSAASVWDKNPGRVHLAQQITKAILEEVKMDPLMEVLDFGCGTGLVTLGLQPYVKAITGVDSSEGMLGVLRSKAAEKKLLNVKTWHGEVDAEDFPKGPFHLVVGSMVLHHVREVGLVLERFHEILGPGGILALADLDLDGGLFHPDPTGVFHNGFDRQELREEFERVGFMDVKVRTAAEMNKKTLEGVENIFPLFLMVGHKREE
jgi:2-polyprenyl-3-methyl-5-hydroxy-6-metoxy-1,4-benzoquinol methylase